MSPKEKEQLVIAAIKTGKVTRAEIIRATGLKYQWISYCLRLLFAEYGVPNLACLQQVLTPAVKTEPKPNRAKFTSHDCVIVDKALRPSLAADMLVQVLGREYCSNLIDALVVACVPPAVAEDETR